MDIPSPALGIVKPFIFNVPPGPRSDVIDSPLPGISLIFCEEDLSPETVGVLKDSPCQAGMEGLIL